MSQALYTVLNPDARYRGLSSRLPAVSCPARFRRARSFAARAPDGYCPADRREHRSQCGRLGDGDGDGLQRLRGSLQFGNDPAGPITAKLPAWRISVGMDRPDKIFSPGVLAGKDLQRHCF